MNILFELSKEHPTLPGNEIISCLKTDTAYKIIEVNNNILAASIDTDLNLIKNVAERLSHTFYIDELFYICSHSIKEIEENAIKYNSDLHGSIAVRYKDRSTNGNSQEIVKKIEKIYTKNRKVNLIKPDNEIRVFITDLKVYVGRKIIAIDRSQYERRKGQFRPFFSPISLHPKIARVLVNLSEVSCGQTIYDPFCGTGGILIEAGLIGANIIGSDVSAKMVQGTKENLSFYNLYPSKLFTADIGEIGTFLDTKVDAVVTDFPYGRASTTMGESRHSLYSRSFEQIAQILHPCARAVLGLPSKEIIET